MQIDWRRRCRVNCANRTSTRRSCDRFSGASPRQRVERIVDAVRELDPCWKAVFVGFTGNFRNTSATSSNFAGKDFPATRLVGWRTDVGNVLRAMDVMVYPSDDGGFARNSLAEAAVGVPTVATEGRLAGVANIP